MKKSSSIKSTDSADLLEKPKPAQRDIGMSAVGKTTEFPRIDNLFMKKESIPFDESQSIIW